jgi:hypothetical protein
VTSSMWWPSSWLVQTPALLYQKPWWQPSNTEQLHGCPLSQQQV